MSGSRWWGWGEDAGAVGLPAGALPLLHEDLGVEIAAAAAPSRVALEEVALPEPRLPDGVRRALESAVGEGNVLDDRLARVAHALGKSYPDLVRVRSGDGSSAPDAVVRPGSAAEVAAVLGACSSAPVAVVPFGGGSSVVGGVEPVRDGFEAAISLDLARMDSVIELDAESLTATVEPGIFGPALEALLAESGMTLGHFPQSFEFSTVGGWVATRSAGQASTGFGRIDELVEGLRCVAPVGELEAQAFPATAAGPSLRELVVGSEGVLGVIVESTLRVRRRPEARHYEAWSFRSFEEGSEAFRVLAQEEAAPDVARLSDEQETRVSLAMASSGSALERVGRAYLRLRGHKGGCLAILGYEGDEQEVVHRKGRAARLVRAAGGLALGTAPGRAWLRGRYAAPYLRDELLDHGVMVETLETAGTWSRRAELHGAVRTALSGTLEERGTPPIVMCHISHLYPSGCSLYFTFFAKREEGAELEQWRAAKSAACDAIVSAGGTITHHHAIGRDHVPWMEAEVGARGLDLLRAAKATLDPAGVMNPGKLLPAGP
jgi:alkyldihydroxyacetonephosphate synthase